MVRRAETAECPVCGGFFVRSGRRRYCSDACRQAAYRLRLDASQVPPLMERLPRTPIVYECPNCTTRRLGMQRCEACGTFGRRLGPGGSCPHCAELVTLAELG
jgi:hypothetical protein